VAAKSLSCLCALLAALFVFLACRKWLGDRILAAAAAAVLMLAPELLGKWSAMVRPYAFALMTSAIAFHAFAKIQERFTPGRMVYFALSAFAMCNSQTLNLALAAALVLIWWRGLLGGPERPRRTAWAFLSVPVIVAVSTVPMLIQSFRFAAGDTGSGRMALTALTPAFFGKIALSGLDTVSGFVSALAYYAFNDYVGRGARLFFTAVPPYLAVALVAVVVPLGWAAGARAYRKLGPRVFDVVILFVVPVLLLGFGSLFNERMANASRAFIATAIGASILLVVILQSSRALLACFLVLSFWRAVIALPTMQERGGGVLSDAKSAADFIRVREQTNDLVVLANGQLAPAFSYYYHGGARQIHHPYSRPIRYWEILELAALSESDAATSNTVAVIREAAGRGERVWLVTSGSPPPEPQKWWYCPQALPKLQDALDAEFVAVTNMNSRVALEPFHVTLYEPAVLKAR